MDMPPRSAATLRRVRGTITTIVGSFHALASPHAIVVGLLITLGSTVRAEERPLSVFVFTATTAVMDLASKQRSASVGDLRKALQDTKGFALASTRNSADLVVEITRAEMMERDRNFATQSSGPLLDAGRATGSDWKCVVDLTVSVGDYTQRFTNTDTLPSSRMYLSAATNLAGQLTTWTKDNRGHILK
jgi:hypothetical protein